MTAASDYRLITDELDSILDALRDAQTAGDTPGSAIDRLAELRLDLDGFADEWANVPPPRP